MNYKFCVKCGHKISANTQFCPYCGTKQSSFVNDTSDTHSANQSVNYRTYNNQDRDGYTNRDDNQDGPQQN